MSSARSPVVLLVALLGALLACDDDGDPPSEAGAADMPGADASLPDAGPLEVGTGACLPIGTPLGPDLAPTRRDDTAFAYDPACGRIFSFFGDQSVPQACSFPPASFATDAYVYDVRQQAWFQVTPSGAGPLPVDRAGAVWDAARQQVIVFGGRYRTGTSGPYTYPSEVWAYDVGSNQWLRLADEGSGPSGRMDFVMVMDEANDRFLISHGGQFTPDFLSIDVFSDTWAFDLTRQSWSPIATGQPQPPARVYPAGSLDRARQALWVFSGSGPNAFLEPPELSMWVLDLTADRWSEMGPQAGWPRARFNAGLIWDEARDRLVLFGGHDDTGLGNRNDVWAFDLDARVWAELRSGDSLNRLQIDPCDPPGDFANVDPSSPERRAAHVFVRTGPDTAIAFGGNTDCGLVNDTWALDLPTATWSRITVSPSGLTCVRNGNPNCSDPSARMCD